ncbi:MAG: recombination protein RecR [Acidobacteria bacterium]|nr:recombination protein RecR [Acidobacteriota bacterium]
MFEHAPTVEHLIKLLRRLPGIGTKSGQRLVSFLLKADPRYIEDLAKSLIELREKVFYCSTCFNITDSDPCSICRSEKRDRSVLCVLENPYDIIPIEKSNSYNGLYHILHGHLSPIEGITPADLKIKELLGRLKNGEIEEVILATNPTVDGESTAHYLVNILKPLGVKLTRIAMGIPVGGDLEYADENTMAKALGGRREI